MFRSIALKTLVLVFAFGIFFTSVISVGAPRYAFSQSSNLEEISSPEDAEVEIIYELPYPGRVAPDHPLWPIKAIRDLIVLGVTLDPVKKAKLNLLYADKRLVLSQNLFEKDKPELGFSTLVKSEMYLDQAYTLNKDLLDKGTEDTHMLRVLANAALKHRQVIEQLLAVSPEDAKPGIVEQLDTSKMIYDATKVALMSRGIDPPKSPFEGQ